MTITHAEAKTARYLLAEHGTPGAAAYQCGVQLRAIAPYTDRHLSKVQRLLRALETLMTTDEAKAARWVATIGEIADRNELMDRR